jgi:CRISPR-associated protein Cas1
VRRKANTLHFETVKINDASAPGDWQQEILTGIKNDLFERTESRIVPIESVDALFTYGMVNFNSRLLSFLARYEIPLHVFTHKGFYSGTFYPRGTNFSGKLLLKQAAYVSDPLKRIIIARELIKAAAYNILSNLRHHHSRGANLRPAIELIGELQDSIDSAEDINTLMGIEGNIRYFYYECWEDIIQVPINFQKRVKNPPSDMVNSMISFGNVMLYSTCLTEIYRSKLHPGLGFLHQPGDKRNSLSFDIAEIFKPLIVDRVIFKLLNRRFLGYQDFITKKDYCIFKPEARKIFIREFDDKLKSTLKDEKLNKHLSYRSLIRNECYKIINHINEEAEYHAFRYSNY